MTVRSIRRFLEEQSVACGFEGDLSRDLTGFSSIGNYVGSTLTWLRQTGTLEEQGLTLPSRLACVVTPLDAPRLPEADAQIRTEDPQKVFFAIVERFWGREEPAVISELAHIEAGAAVGNNVSIGVFSWVSAQTVIGDGCKIGAQVTIRGRVVIGDNCVIQSGAVIGEDGFAVIREPGSLTSVGHYGGVTIGSHVSIGANTCVCRGTIDDTRIKDYAKIDNLCHIAHNAVIGERTVVVAGAVVMGSVIIGDDCWISASMIRDHRSVGDSCVVGIGAVVVNNIASGMTVAGNPARPFAGKNAAVKDHE